MHTQLLDALGTLLQGLGESLPCVRIHMHARTHTQTHNAVTFLSHTHGNGLRWSKDRCPELYKSSWRTEQRCACLPPPPSYLHTCCTALTRLPAPNLVFLQRWHTYQAEQEMSWVRREQLPDRCHLQSAQVCLWCVNYSINQHIALSGCQHLITSETLPVNGSENMCARMCGWQVTHHVTVKGFFSLWTTRHSHRICGLEYVHVCVYVCVF